MECLVIGLGVFGKSLAESLKGEGISVVGVDTDEKSIKESVRFLDEAIRLDTTVEDNLRQLGVEYFDYTFVCIGANMEASLNTTLNLANLGASKIVARSNSKAHGLMLQKLGAYKIVSPEIEFGKQLTQEINSGVNSYNKIRGNMVIVTVSVPEGLVGKSLKELSLRKNFRVNVLWVAKNIPYVTDSGEESTIERYDEILSSDYVFNPYDHIAILGSLTNIKRFLDTFQDNGIQEQPEIDETE